MAGRGSGLSDSSGVGSTSSGSGSAPSGLSLGGDGSDVSLGDEAVSPDPSTGGLVGSVVAPFPFPAKSPPRAEPSPPRIDLFPPGVCVVFGVAAVFAGSVAAAEAWAI